MVVSLKVGCYGKVDLFGNVPTDSGMYNFVAYVMTLKK